MTDSLITVIETDEGFEAYPFGFEGGPVGVFATEEEALAVAEMVVKGTHCCSDADFGGEE